MLFANIDDPDSKDQKLSMLEKGVILAFIPLAKLILWKLRKAKTYGDIVKLGEFIEKKVDDMEDKYHDDEFKDEASVDVLKQEISLTTSEIEEL